MSNGVGGMIGSLDQFHIEVQMLGGFHVLIDGCPLNEKTERSKQVMSLFCYLLVKRYEYIPQERLIEVLWPQESSDNPTNALKNLIYRLRRYLSTHEALKDIECIKHVNGTYTWNNEIPCTLDVEELVRLSKMGGDDSLSRCERIECYQKALSYYRGGFLSDLSYFEWVVPLITFYQNIYINTLHETVQLLTEENMHEEVVSLCEQAVVYEPYEESIHARLLKAHVALGKRTKALEHYEGISKKFYKELGVKLSSPLREIHKDIVKSLNTVETDLSVIKQELSEVNQEAGAFFCDYEVFKQLYRLEMRTAERIGQSVFVGLITLNIKQESGNTKELLLKSMDGLKDVIMASLRKGDVVSRFSAAQYILMLPTATFENGEKVLTRITEKFKRACRNPYITASMTIEPIDSAM